MIVNIGYRTELIKKDIDIQFALPKTVMFLPPAVITNKKIAVIAKLVNSNQMRILILAPFVILPSKRRENQTIEKIIFVSVNKVNNKKSAIPP